MLPPLLDTTARSTRDQWLWAFIGFLVVGQIGAFWMLCLSQVHKAELRHAEARISTRVATARTVDMRTDSAVSKTLLARDDGVRQRAAFSAD